MIKVKKIKPLFTALITTMDLYEEDSKTKGGLIDSTRQKGTIKEYQKVIAVGDTVKCIKPGDLVKTHTGEYHKVISTGSKIRSIVIIPLKQILKEETLFLNTGLIL